MKTFLSFLLAVALIASNISAQQYAGIDVLSTDVTINGISTANDFLLPFIDPVPAVTQDQKVCLPFQNVPLNPAFTIKALPSSDQSLYCILRAVESDICAKTSAVTATGFELGGDANSLIMQWQVAGFGSHLTEIGNGYAANTITNGSIEVTLEIDASQVPPPNPTILYYEYFVWLAAYAKPELLIEDDAIVNATAMSLNGVDLLAAGNFPTGFAAGPAGSGQGRQMRLSGWVNFTPNSPFTLDVAGNAMAMVGDIGIPNNDAACGLRWLDNAGAVFFGNLKLSLAPIVSTAPPVGSKPGNSLFSVDIGGDTEISDPFLTGNEVFDPGDMYKVKSPLFPPGGGDGLVDDAFYMAGDYPPSAPDVLIPSATAAPIGSGLSITDVVDLYYDLDGFDRLNFIPSVSTNGGPPIPIPAGGGCLDNLRHIFVSFDDDSPSLYTDITGSVATNSTGTSSNAVFGSTANKDELMEVFTPSLFTVGISGPLSVASESDIHPQLGPNPPPLGPALENDDVDALALNFTSGCDIAFLSVDHEAVGVELGGTVLDPGIIYSYTPVTISLVPRVSPINLGLPLGIDIDAFEFVAAYDAAIIPGSPYVAMLFSVDSDDPSTFFVDESGGLNPAVLYISPLNGTYKELDQGFVFPADIDAISTLPISLAGGPAAQTCNPSNFSTAPLNFTANVQATNVLLNWTPYPFAKACRLSGNKTTAVNDASILAGNYGSAPAPSTYSINLSQLQSGTTYRIKLSCGCSSGLNSPETPYLFFTTPVSPGPSPLVESDIFDNHSDMEAALKNSIKFDVYPNPASAFATVIAGSLIEGEVTVSLYNSLGQRVRSETVSAETIRAGYRFETDDLSEGIYSVSLIGKEAVGTRTIFISGR